MENARLLKISKFLSWALRHHPEAIGLELQVNGWVSIEELLAAAEAHQQGFSREELLYVVAHNNKQRFGLDDTQELIRARQGHSTNVKMEFPQKEPPALLYHGTVAKFMEAIRQEGLRKMERHHVHLSPDQATALQVGSRKGKARVLVVDSGQMHADGYVFYLSDNGVWLSEEVPARYIQFPERVK